MNELHNPECPLCGLGNMISNHYWKDEICVVVDCLVCKQPQIVLMHHGTPNKRELEHMEIISKKLFPDKRWGGCRKEITGHFNKHFV